MAHGANQNHLAERFDVAQDIEAEVLRLIRSVRFGSVEIRIHDARVVQIERREKTRLV